MDENPFAALSSAESGGPAPISEIEETECNYFGFKEAFKQHLEGFQGFESGTGAPLGSARLFAVTASKRTFAAASQNKLFVGSLGDFKTHSIDRNGITHVDFIANDKGVAVAHSGGVSLYTLSLELLKSITLSALSELRANPAFESVAALCQGGAFYILGEQQTQISSSTTAISWSKRGKQIAAGNKDGQIITYTPDGSQKATYPSPVSGKIVSSLHWIDNTTFFAVYNLPATNPPAHEYDCFLISTNPLSFTNVFNPAPPFGDETRTGYHHIQHLYAWPPKLSDMLFIGASASSDIGVLVRFQDKKWTQLNLDDARRAQLPEVNDKDTTPIGLATDLGATDKVSIGESQIDPLPILCVLDNTGGITGYHVVYDEAAHDNQPYPEMQIARNPNAATSSSSTRDAKPPAGTSQPAFGQSSPAAQATAQPASGQPTFGQSASATVSGLGANAAPAFGTSTFGQSSSQPSFGNTSFGALKPMFGSSGFGQSAQPFGAPAFGQQAGHAEVGFGFGKSTAPTSFAQLASGHSGSPSVFEQPRANDSAPSTKPAFQSAGYNQTPSQTPAVGQQSSQPSAFGPPSACSSFGQPSAPPSVDSTPFGQSANAPTLGQLPQPSARSGQSSTKVSPFNRPPEPQRPFGQAGLDQNKAPNFPSLSFPPKPGREVSKAESDRNTSDGSNVIVSAPPSPVSMKSESSVSPNQPSEEDPMPTMTETMDNVGIQKLSDGLKTESFQLEKPSSVGSDPNDEAYSQEISLKGVEAKTPSLQSEDKKSMDSGETTSEADAENVSIQTPTANDFPPPPLPPDHVDTGPLSPLPPPLGPEETEFAEESPSEVVPPDSPTVSVTPPGEPEGSPGVAVSAPISSADQSQSGSTDARKVPHKQAHDTSLIKEDEGSGASTEPSQPQPPLPPATQADIEFPMFTPAEVSTPQSFSPTPRSLLSPSQSEQPFQARSPHAATPEEATKSHKNLRLSSSRPTTLIDRPPNTETEGTTSPPSSPQRFELPPFENMLTVSYKPSHRKGFEGQVESLALRVSKEMEIVQRNVENLHRFIAAENVHTRRLGADIVDQRLWCMGDISDFAFLTQDVLDKTVMKKEKLGVMEKELEHVKSSLVKLEAKRIEIGRSVRMHSDPQIGVVLQKPLPPEQAELRRTLRKRFQEVDQSIAKLEQSIPEAKARLAGVSVPAPTVDAVMRSIDKIAALTSESIARVASLERQLRRLRASSPARSSRSRTSTPARSVHRSTMLDHDDNVDVDSFLEEATSRQMYLQKLRKTMMQKEPHRVVCSD